MWAQQPVPALLLRCPERPHQCARSPLSAHPHPVQAPCSSRPKSPNSKGLFSCFLKANNAMPRKEGTSMCTHLIFTGSLKLPSLCLATTAAGQSGVGSSTSTLMPILACNQYTRNFQTDPCTTCVPAERIMVACVYLERSAARMYNSGQGQQRTRPESHSICSQHLSQLAPS